MGHIHRNFDAFFIFADHSAVLDGSSDCEAVLNIHRGQFGEALRCRSTSQKEFDTIARLETQAIDEYNDNHHYRNENPLDYLHANEATVTEDKYASFHD